MRLGSKVFLLVLLAAASAQAGEIFGGPPKVTGQVDVSGACSGAALQGEASCPSCGACYNAEAPEYTFLLAEQTYDAKDDTTVVSFLVTPPADCSYASFGIKLQDSVSTLPTLPLPTSQGFLPAPTIVSGCDADTGLGNSLVFALDGPDGPDQYGTYTAMLKLRGKFSMHDLFVPIVGTTVVNGNGDDVTPFKSTASADTFMVVLNNSPNTVCGAAKTCSFATVTAASVPVTSENGLAFVSSTLDPTVFPPAGAPGPSESPESPESPEPQPPSPAPGPEVPVIPIVLPPFPAWESPESPESPEPGPNGTVPFTCPQYYNVWAPQCFDKSPACPQVWSSASNLNPFGSEVSVQRQYDSGNDRTSFTFTIRWGAIGCEQYVDSMLPVASLCTMNHFVLPLAPGVVPEKFGYLTPLVPGATDMDAITLQPGCDVGQDSGLQNTATWSMDVVEPATRQVLMKEGGVFASVIFIGDVEYQQAFAMITDDSFVASNTGKPVEGLISIPWGSVSFLVEGAEGWTANGYYQYMASPPPPPVSQPGSGSTPGFTPAPTPGSGTVGAASINTIQIPGIGLVTFTINADGSVTISGVGTLSVHGTPGGPAYVTIPGIGEVLIPGYLVPSTEVATSSVVNGTIPVTASGEITIDHSLCSGDLTVTAAVSGALAPIVTLTPATATLPFGKVQKIAVSVTGKTMDSAYNGIVTLTLKSADPACSATILAAMVSASSMSMGTGKAVASMAVLAPASANTVPVAINMAVNSPTLTGVKPAVMNSMLALMQTVDPTGSLINWAPSTPYCSFTGVACDTQGAITSISLAGMGLTGSLPTDAALWSALSTVSSFNAAGNKLTGPIPAALSALANAATIDLSGNALEGTIPASLAALSPAASLVLDNNAGVCGGVPRTIVDSVAVSTTGTSVATPCFEDAILVLDGRKSAAVGENTRLTAVSAPAPAYVESFDAEAATAELTSTPFIGTLAVDGKPLAIGGKVSFAALQSSKVVYTLNAGAAAQAVDTFTFGVTPTEGAPASTLTVTVVQQLGSSGFPADATVTVQTDAGSASKALSDVVVGDKVLAACGSTACFSDVYIVPVQQATSEHAFVELTTDFGNAIVLGGSQYVSASADGKTFLTMTADYVEVGMWVQVVNPVNSQDLAPSKVTSMAWVSAPGQVLPLTLKGSIIVNGAAVSVYNDAMGSLDAMATALKPLQTAYTNMQGAPAGDAATYQAAYVKAAASAAGMMAKSD